MHPANWDSTIRLENKIVGVVGCGATSMQVVPYVVKKAKEVILYNRSAPYILPRHGNFETPWIFRFLLRIFPFLMWAMRAGCYLAFEIIAGYSYTTNSVLNRLGKLIQTYKGQNLFEIFTRLYFM